jgi:NTP pyrophosphatase (non-canonical NTP hydrolase)
MKMKSYENVMTTDGLDALARDVNEWARGKGFWENPIQVSDLKEDERLTQLTKTQKVLLVVTELAELTEGIRKPSTPSSVEGVTNEEEELADTIIRCLDYAGQYRLRLGLAVRLKMALNEGRIRKHGKEF